ncbi:MAG TPA: hypothetical protein VGR37_01375 [Longimicrobiaceae bacterium]|nr:hypothetical protein [Longimicrobiaceae bacterium]
MTFLYHAHSGLRYLVLLAAVLAILYLAFGWATRRPYDRTARVLVAIFTGTLDLQVLLGIALLFVRPFYPALMGHIVMMLLAAIAAHGFSVFGRGRPDERQRYGVVLAGVVVALVLVLGGIMAIGRGVFQMSVS